uniref:Uncharacterized protein n=1 Tax=Megaviridae environmental sample TaxID=1737588 RepID=A0A5J6VK61_9VIRU|nr:MAG: hypothetical protein [Megaviridae environmental sample]
MCLLPRLDCRSQEEIQWSCYLISCLYGGQNTENLVKLVINAMRLGDEMQLIDLVIELDEFLLGFEYDGGYWHGKDRIESDTKKTLACVNEPKLNMLRVRSDGAAELCIDHPKVHIKNIAKGDPKKSFLQVAKFICDIPNFPIHYIANIKKSISKPTTLHKTADECLQSVLCSLDKNYSRSRDQVKNLLGEKNTKIVLNTHGILTKLSLLPNFIIKLKAFGFTIDKIVTFMSNSVAARIQDDAFMARLKELKELGFTIDKIVTFMCDGVAARIQDDAFMARLKELIDFGFTIDKIVTFMSNSVAARIQDDAFMARLKELKELGFTIDKIVTFMCDGVAARIQDDAFMARLKELIDFGFTIDKIVTFMSNGVAARIQDDAFMARLKELIDFGFTIDKIVTFMCDGVAARIQDDAFMARLKELKELGFTIDKIVTFMCGGVAARIQDDVFMARLKELIAFGFTIDKIVTFMCGGGCC